MKYLLAALALVSLALSGILGNSAVAQTSESCSAFSVAVTGDKNGTVAVVPERLLADPDLAVPCLVRIVDALGAQINSPIMLAEPKNRLLSTTGALRAIMTKLISVVAPWAYKENYESIEKTRNTINAQIDRNDSGLKTTVYILDNIETRLQSQKSDSNKLYSLKDRTLVSCRRYVEAYRPRLTSTANLVY